MPSRERYCVVAPAAGGGGLIMARLIDADRALEVVRNQGTAHPDAYHLTNYATLILREAPTVDAVPVVRCRDCKYFETWLCQNEDNSDNWFCADGERKDGDG